MLICFLPLRLTFGLSEVLFLLMAAFSFSPSSSAFPPLNPSSSTISSLLGAPPSSTTRRNEALLACCNSKDLLTSQNSSSKEIKLSFIPCADEEAVFSKEELSSDQKEWGLSLVGHVIGKISFYGSLLAAIKKKWIFKCNLDLLPMEGDFFLFKFLCSEDYNMVWNCGPYYLNDKPFILKKWSKDFHPIKKNFVEIPIWVKFPNLPLCCWNDTSFSKIASKVGIPLTVDSLMANKSCITFARVCVQISPSSLLPNEVSLNLDGTIWKQGVVYDWKPSACLNCNTFCHDHNNYPLKPQKSF